MLMTPWAIAHLYTDRLIALMAEPGVAPDVLDRAADLSRLWLYLAECLD